MKSFIFVLAMIACLMVAQGSPVVDDDDTTDGVVGVDMSLLKAVNGQQCMAIGGLCNLADDCCLPLKCAGYRKRCVT